MASTSIRMQQLQQSSTDANGRYHPLNSSTSKGFNDGTMKSAMTMTKIDKENSINNTQRRPYDQSQQSSQRRTALGGSTSVALSTTPSLGTKRSSSRTSSTNMQQPYQTPRQPKQNTVQQLSTTAANTTTSFNNNTTTPYSLLSMEMNRFRHSQSHAQDTDPHMENNHTKTSNNNHNNNHRHDMDCEDDDDDDDVSLLCSPILLHPASNKPKAAGLAISRRCIQPTNLSSPPGRIPVQQQQEERLASSALVQDEEHNQIAIFRNTSNHQSSMVAPNNPPTINTSSTNTKTTHTQSIPLIAHNGLSRPPFTSRMNDVRPSKPMPSFKESKAVGTKIVHQTKAISTAIPTQVPVLTRPLPPRINATIANQSIDNNVIGTATTSDGNAIGNQSSKWTRFSNTIETPMNRTETTMPTTTFPITSILRNTSTKKINNPTFSTFHPTLHCTPVVDASLRSTSVIQGTNGKKGICMDLSEIFFDAASKVSVRSTAVHQPHSPNCTAEPTTTVDERMDDDRSVLYETDEQEWAEKQVEMFTKWMNYLFYPTEDQTEVKRSDPTTSTAPLRTLLLHQRMTQSRTVAHTLFHGNEMQRIRDVLCNEIGRDKIVLRPDRDLYANLDHRNMILSMLLSYSTPWLRLGLETMFHTVILPEQPTLFSPKPPHQLPGVAKRRGSSKLPISRLKLMLKKFIVQNILSDDIILAKYTGGKCKVPSGPFEERYRAELRTVVLYRLLTLILFLDRAKMFNILDQAPNLFVTSSPVKSTREVLLFICRNFLKAEGDFTKHLSRLGIKVHYQQESVDELDFTVSNLRVDLNDGVRLSRMTELLTGVNLLTKLRLPAVSRLQKLYNVKLAIDHLIGAGVPVSDAVVPHHIVDGHREMVLKLLWSVVAHCCLQALLSVEQVEAEITRIERYHGLTKLSTLRGQHQDGIDLELALLRWCNVVCSRFGRNVTDFTKSFADGKAVCLLIHYYHPTLIRLKDIRMTSQDTLAKYSSTEKITANERSNGTLANIRMAMLGGIPEVIPVCDTQHPPEEKSMLFCLTFLCSRLITSSVEIRASIIIQNSYRSYRHRFMLMYKIAAATKILSAWRTNKAKYYRALTLKYSMSVRVIERFVLAKQTALYNIRLQRQDQQKANVAAVNIQVILFYVTNKSFVVAYSLTSIYILSTETCSQSNC
jgi:CAMSAP CH domain/Calponin homology (CH) domain